VPTSHFKLKLLSGCTDSQLSKLEEILQLSKPMWTSADHGTNICGSAGLVHVDHTTLGGVNRLHAVLPDEAEKLSKTPFTIVQVYVLYESTSQVA